jgi:hypothetical protein
VSIAVCEWAICTARMLHRSVVILGPREIGREGRLEGCTCETPLLEREGTSCAPCPAYPNTGESLISSCGAWTPRRSFHEDKVNEETTAQQAEVIPLRVIITRARAKAAGLDRYFTGEPCTKGHVAPRCVSTTVCISCLEQATGKQTTEPDNPKEIWLSRSLSAAKGRARKQGVPFALTRKYMRTLMADTCPALGCPLVYNKRGGQVWNSATIDKINPALGYVPGNVAVISMRANRIKSNATADELQAITTWLKEIEETLTCAA